MEFKYKILEQENLDDTQENFISELPLEDNEQISIKKSDDGSTMIIANKTGWIRLAKICVEMAYSADTDPQYHIHKTSSFGISTNNADDSIGFFISEEK